MGCTTVASDSFETCSNLRRTPAVGSVTTASTTTATRTTLARWVPHCRDGIVWETPGLRSVLALLVTTVRQPINFAISGPVHQSSQGAAPSTANRLGLSVPDQGPIQPSDGALVPDHALTTLQPAGPRVPDYGSSFTRRHRGCRAQPRLLLQLGAHLRWQIRRRRGSSPQRSPLYIRSSSGPRPLGGPLGQLAGRALPASPPQPATRFKSARVTTIEDQGHRRPQRFSGQRQIKIKDVPLDLRRSNGGAQGGTTSVQPPPGGPPPTPI
jgi:hypothetical protein